MRSLLIVPALALASLSFGLTVGDKAPALSAETTVKGAPVNLAKGVHVVEFWATWCGPCKQSIPHLTQMAAKYKGKVDFTGVSVWENGPDQLGQVKKFVAEMGPKMAYNVAWDGDKKTMATGWMDAAKQNGIPAAFLVKDGKVLWIGHPMDGLDKAIDQVLAGKYDPVAAKAKFDAQMAERDKEMKAQAEMTALLAPIGDAVRRKDTPGALKAIDDAEAKRPDLRSILEQNRFSILSFNGDPKALDVAHHLAENEIKNDPQALNSLAWNIVDPDSKVKSPNYPAALVFAKRAAEATDMKDGMILDTYALALYKTSDKKQALEVQTKAVAFAKATKDFDAASLKDMESRLAMYQKDAG